MTDIYDCILYFKDMADIDDAYILYFKDMTAIDDDSILYFKDMA